MTVSDSGPHLGNFRIVRTDEMLLRFPTITTGPPGVSDHPRPGGRLRLQLCLARLFRDRRRSKPLPVGRIVSYAALYWPVISVDEIMKSADALLQATGMF